MKYLVIISLLMVWTVGCQPHPRYRVGGEERRPELNQSLQGSQTTNENIKLGLILQSYLGKPYKGRSKYEEGLDCSFFTFEVFKKYNRTILPRTAADQFKEGKIVHFNHLKYGDLVFFKTVGHKISHVGVYVDKRRFIHASSSRGIIVSHLNEKYWSERYAGARRVLK